MFPTLFGTGFYISNYDKLFKIYLHEDKQIKLIYFW
jgi:hypothetical protein